MRTNFWVSNSGSAVATKAKGEWEGVGEFVSGFVAEIFWVKFS